MSELVGTVLTYAGHGGGSSSTSTNSTMASGHGSTGSAIPSGKKGKIQIAQSDAAYAVYYQYAIAAVVGIFFLRYILLLVTRHYAGRQRRETALEKGGRGRGVTAYAEQPTILRLSDSLDSWMMKPLWGDFTRLKGILHLAFFSLNLAFCLVDGPLTVEKDTGFATSVAISLRTGMIATASYPIMFLLAGRSSIVGFLTGISYIELRYWHIVSGWYSFFLSLVHTVCYVANYYMNQDGAKTLAQQCKRLYFQLGIVALVFMGMNWLFGLKWVRRRGYELFLLSHIVGAMLVLAGSAAGVWVFERVCRWGMHFAHIAHAKLYVKAPPHRATATVVDGAIKLTVPVKDHRWKAGQHYYIAFWGLDLLRRPWLYGQVHPFSTTNAPNESAGDEQELRFLLRIHNGLTKDLAKHIQKRCEAKGGIDFDVLVTLEGPYGSAEDAAAFDSVLLIAGGSGITHPMSTFHELSQRVAAGKAATSNIKLIWAMHHYDQANWAVETLFESRAWAEQGNDSTSVDLYITRPDSRSSSSSSSSSGTSTPSELDTPSSLDEKKSFLYSETVDFAGGRTNRFYGRPDVKEEVRKAIEESQGRTLVVVCGPTSIAKEVRLATKAYRRSQVVAEIATFEC
ncbi:hypothetical protein JCM8547_009279 [Rhodosporidiobolus lusitaniae]